MGTELLSSACQEAQPSPFERDILVTKHNLYNTKIEVQVQEQTTRCLQMLTSSKQFHSFPVKKRGVLVVKSTGG